MRERLGRRSTSEPAPQARRLGPSGPTRLQPGHDGPLSGCQRAANLSASSPDPGQVQQHDCFGPACHGTRGGVVRRPTLDGRTPPSGGTAGSRRGPQSDEPAPIAAHNDLSGWHRWLRGPTGSARIGRIYCVKLTGPGTERDIQRRALDWPTQRDPGPLTSADTVPLGLGTAASHPAPGLAPHSGHPDACHRGNGTGRDGRRGRPPRGGGRAGVASSGAPGSR